MTDTAADTSAGNPKLRKRTKTGCLTCRKRRIKCGEERPTCNNCIKSKRHCEGYNQRVIFKPPIGDWPGVHHGSSTLQYHNGLLPGTQPALQRPVPPPIHTLDPSAVQLPPGPVYANPSEHGQTLPLSAPAVFAGTAYQTQQQATPLPSPFTTPSFTPISPPHFQPIFSVPIYGQSPIAISGHIWPQRSLQTPPHTEPPNFQQPSFETGSSLEFTSPPQPPTPTSTSQDFKPVFTEPSLPTPVSSTTLQTNATLKREDSVPKWPPIAGDELGTGSFFVDAQAFSQPPTEIPFHGSPDQDSPTINTPPPSSTAIDPMRQPLILHVEVSPTQHLEAAAIEDMDDDYYDVQSDEEMDLVPDQAVIRAYEAQYDFTMMLNLHREGTNELSMRRYDNFIYDGILDYYRPEWVANPLKNPNTARVFMHFITSTGPTLSIFERFPRNTSAFFDEWPPSTPPRGLWNYSMPMMALNHQGLLHSMLAISSLHIAKLKCAAMTPSIKHYMYAVKRMNRCVGNPKKKLLPTTLAATLLLAFYEVMTAEHVKWCSHLSGAKSLISEIDYLSMSKEARRLKAEAAGHRRQHSNSDIALQCEIYSQTEDDHHPIDENIVSAFFGKKLNYDQFGRIIDDLSNGKRRNSLPELFDLGRFELYQDLFWWYAKQDCFQSIISGNPLLLDYNKWADCPPRASFGRSDALYGTFDHLILLLGRIADFTARDRLRKIKVVDANGGQWRPQPGMDLGGPPASRNANPTNAQHPQKNEPQTTSNAPTQMQSSQPPPQPPNPPKPARMPTFYGMAPSPSTVHTPSAYTRNARSSPNDSPKSTKSETDLNAATASALEEWQRIRTALDLFAQNLGPAFQPMPTEYHSQPCDSPFGGVIQYRSYDIANIWALYYTCHIIILRAHPHMPPAAMIAAGVAAAQTARYANLIGQIAAGIVPSLRSQHWNPSIGACLCEICMPLFFAGIQYRSAEQRAWLVSRVREIEAHTGWASLGMIAHGCETSWIRAWEAGRGPKYVRVPVGNMDMNDERVTRRGGHLDPTSQPKDLSDRRFIHVNPSTRVHWAVGLLADEQDIERDVE